MISQLKKYSLGVKYNIRHIGGNYHRHISELLYPTEHVVEKIALGVEFIIGLIILIPVFAITLITFPIKLLILSPIKGSKMTDERYETITNELK